MLIYDLEIEKAILSKNTPRLESIDYCGGWNDYENMGISVVGVYDYATDRHRVFTDSNKEEFFLLLDSSDVLVGFNNIGFDNKVINACWGNMPEDRCYDILKEIWAGVGLGPDFNLDTHYGYNLDDVCLVNFGQHHQKSGNGAMAPVEWQRGRYGNVIDYCLNDVRLTKHLLDKIISDGYIRHPKKPGTVIEVRKPVFHKKITSVSFN